MCDRFSRFDFYNTNILANNQAKYIFRIDASESFFQSKIKLFKNFKLKIYKKFKKFKIFKLYCQDSENPIGEKSFLL